MDRKSFITLARGGVFIFFHYSLLKGQIS